MKTAAAGLGFDACGIAAAGVVDPEDRLGAWLAQGFHAGMNWLAATKDLRQDVRLKLPGARSVVVVARNYYAPRPDPSPESGRVSRYAWGRDYHRVLRRPLNALARTLEIMEPNTRCYVCIDSGPVLERGWAAQAGLGWIGKNSLVIRKDLGSWFFLGVLVTTLELAPDGPAVDRCGTCDRCMQACPTGAIVAPGVVDARRCVSYLTIEHKGAIPDALQAGVGAWVFGCDACQEACPWNRSVPDTSERDFHPRPGHANPYLAEWSEMSEPDFRQEFAGTPILRAKYAGIQRNIAIVSRNLGIQSASG